MANDFEKIKLTHGSLFSGIGGFELGAERQGIETVWNCEIEEYNRRILKQHFKNAKQYTDVRELTNPEYVDIISGGFPCQDISIANTNATGIKGSRSGLWSEMFRIIRVVRPKYIIIENSPMLLVRGFERVLCDLSEIGFNAEWQSLSAEAFGYCHKRERLYCIVLLTPTASDGMRKKFKLQSLIKRYQKHPGGNLAEQLAGKYEIKITAKLCEMMMGYPTSWTELKAAETL